VSLLKRKALRHITDRGGGGTASPRDHVDINQRRLLKETVIAEKLEALTKFERLSSRLKDYYALAFLPACIRLKGKI
jgi:hypothetical protein